MDLQPIHCCLVQTFWNDYVICGQYCTEMCNSSTTVCVHAVYWCSITLVWSLTDVINLITTASKLSRVSQEKVFGFMERSLAFSPTSMQLTDFKFWDTILYHSSKRSRAKPRDSNNINFSLTHTLEWYLFLWHTIQLDQLA